MQKGMALASDQEAAQAPVLILPHSFLDRLPSPLPMVVKRDKVASAVKRAGWLQLAETLLSQNPANCPKLGRMVAYLRRVGQGTPAVPILEPLVWHSSAKQDDVLRPQSLHTFALLLPVVRFKARLT